MLGSIPASCLNQVILKLPLDTSSEGFSDEMSETQRLDFLRKKGRDISSNIAVLRKLWRMISPKRIFSSYLVIQSMPIALDTFSEAEFSARDYLHSGSISVRGRLHALALPESCILLVIEFSSRSPYYRRFYRYIVGPSFFLVEENEGAMDLFQELLQPLLILFDFEPNQISSKQFKRIFQGDFTVLEIELEVDESAVPGLSRISLTGDNLVRGVRTLRSRQEVDVMKMASRILSVKIPDLTISLHGITMKTMTPAVLRALSTIFENGTK